MKLLFFDRDPAMVEAWADAFQDESGLDYEVADVSEVVHVADVVSTAGNSWGIMGAGLDGAIRQAWPEVQPRVQQAIGDHYCGEMPVGAPSLIVRNTTRDRFAYTPTMRNPGTRDLDPFNVYLAMRGLLIATRDQPRGDRLAVPGMGTGIGKVSPEACAHWQQVALQQVRKAGWHLP